MLDKKTIFEIHRLADQGVSIKKISEILVKDRKTVRKYLNDPHLTRKPANRKSKLDPSRTKLTGCSLSTPVPRRSLSNKDWRKKAMMEDCPSSRTT
jgi:DNA-binding transcriptional MerR regulator